MKNGCIFRLIMKFVSWISWRNIVSHFKAYEILRNECNYYFSFWGCNFQAKTSDRLELQKKKGFTLWEPKVILNNDQLRFSTHEKGAANYWKLYCCCASWSSHWFYLLTPIFISISKMRYLLIFSLPALKMENYCTYCRLASTLPKSNRKKFNILIILNKLLLKVWNVVRLFQRTFFYVGK